LCQQSLRLHPSHPETVLQLNVILRQLGRQEEAMRLSWRCITASREQDSGADDKVPRRGTSDRRDEVMEAPEWCHSDDAPGAKWRRKGRSCVVCVKWGRKYGADYVNRLARGVRRCVDPSLEYDFLCLTDDLRGLDESLVRAHRFPPDFPLKTWWAKAYMFSPECPLTPGACSNPKSQGHRVRPTLMEHVRQVIGWCMSTWTPW
jgi:hypothetical protein